MLIPCERHTRADLEFWRTTEAADVVHGELIFERGSWRKAVDEMRRFADAGPCYVATSWGKDSVVLSHLLTMSGLRLPLVNVAQHGPQYDVYCPLVRDAFLDRFDVAYHEIAVDADERGRHDGQHSKGLDEGIAIAAKLLGTRRYIGGVRASESGRRKIRMRTIGLSNADTCQPLGWWSAADVFGWLAFHSLPVHPAYAMTGGGRWDREQIRVSTIGGAKGRQFGRADWEREYYGDVLRRMESARPRGRVS